MIISVINHSELADELVLKVIRAINRQIAEDFTPFWSITASLRLEGRSGSKPDPKNPADMRGDAVLYLWDEVNVEDALGYHEANFRGIPFGFVFTQLSKEMGESWTVTFSHEGLELIADPEANLLVAGPHPDHPDKEVFHWFEMCDAVQSETYEIDGIEVSNFLLPLYFTSSNEKGGRNDFLTTRKNGAALKSFGIKQGGYVGFYDPAINKHDTVSRDETAKRRMEIKAKAREARRANRYRSSHTGTPAPVTFGEPVLEGFSVKFAATATNKVAAISRTLGRGWRIERFGKNAEYFEVTHPNVKYSVTEAWAKAYALRANPDLAGAEPMFEVRLDTPSEPANKGQRASSLFGSSHLPGTENKEWAINLLKVKEAWNVPTQHGALRGKGIVIGHPDTGYTHHVEIFDPQRLLKDRGKDFVAGDNDPLDELDSGLLLFPGHGTKSSSVIMSSDVAQGGSMNQITGVAPEASLIPIRVSRSVVLLSMKNLTRAIHHAIEQHVHVISISMGGLWNGALHEAVTSAVSAGIIVLAAAGNEVRFVTWPAAFDEVIAVAGCNIERGVWSGSSRGPAVDITAPGESVWVATPVEADGAIVSDVDRSSGTSFAVAHTAGIAALWLAYHGRDALIAAVGGPENLAAAFKRQLQQTCKTPAGWRTDEFGPGIVDAESLLRAGMPTAAAPHARTLTRRSAPSSIERAAHIMGITEEALVTGFAEMAGIDEDAARKRLGAEGDEIVFRLATSGAMRSRLQSAVRLRAATRSASA